MMSVTETSQGSESLVSIIIPVYNREQYISDALDSIKNQSYSNWECIVVDDGSDDNTISVVTNFVKHDGRFRLIERYHEPKGANTCRNIGLSNLDGDYFMLLDSDDLLAPFCLENRLQAAQEYPNYDAWVFRSVYFQNEQITKKEFYFEDSEESPELAFLLRPQWAMNGSMFCTQKFRKSSILFQERLPFWQDWAFHLDAILQGIVFCRNLQFPPDVYIRTHNDENRINNNRKIHKEEIAVLFQFLDRTYKTLSRNEYFESEFFTYRMYYLFQYLIRKDCIEYIDQGLRFIEHNKLSEPLIYKLTGIVLRVIRHLRLNNRVLAYGLHRINEPIKRKLLESLKL